MKTIEISDDVYALLEEIVAFSLKKWKTPEELIEELIKEKSQKFHTVELL